MHILVLLTDLFDAIGGIQTFNRCLVKALDELAEKNNWKITILVLNDDKSVVVDKPYIREQWSTYRGFANNRLQFVYAASKVALDVDIIFFGHVNFIPLAVFFRLINFKANIILMLHDVEIEKRFSLLKQIGLKRVNKFLSNSTITRDRAICLEKLNREKFYVFPCTLEIQNDTACYYKSREELFPSFSSELILLTVSRLEKVSQFKNIDMVIRSIPHILKEVPNVFYVIVGDGTDRFRLEQVAKDAGVADRVIFAGKISDEILPSYYKACDVFVLPSTNEGFGIVFLEAMNYAKPCVGVKAGGVQDIICHKETGFLSEPDDLKNLVQYLVLLLKNKDVRDSFGAGGRERLKKEFSFEIFRSRLEKILANSIGKSQKII